MRTMMTDAPEKDRAPGVYSRGPEGGERLVHLYQGGLYNLGDIAEIFSLGTPEDSGYVFQIVDNGIGIAFEDIPKALAPFHQIDGTLNRKYKGTGLGLPLTKSLVELHGGSLDLQSEVGKGTTVTVRFPANRIVAAAGTQSPAAPALAW